MRASLAQSAQLIKLGVFALAVLTLFGLRQVHAQVQVGLRIHESASLTYGVWYPTAFDPNQQRLGPFNVSYASNASPLQGSWPVVLFSHGNGGRWRNHYLTASELARHGMVVISPQHSQDRWMGTSRTESVMGQRARDLSLALAHVLGQSDLSAVADTRRLYALGYSLGGATVLHAAGIRLDLSQAKDHCELQAVNDRDFCDEPAIWWRTWAHASDVVLSLSGPHPQPPTKPLSLSKVALVAPVGQGLSATDLGSYQAKIWLQPIQNDAVLKEPFHSSHLRNRLKSAQVTAPSPKVGHHFAFIGPFPEWLLKKERIPIGEDPPGFDRMQFIQSINHELIRFFKGNQP